MALPPAAVAGKTALSSPPHDASGDAALDRERLDALLYCFFMRVADLILATIAPAQGMPSSSSTARAEPRAHDDRQLRQLLQDAMSDDEQQRSAAAQQLFLPGVAHSSHFASELKLWAHLSALVDEAAAYSRALAQQPAEQALALPEMVIDVLLDASRLSASHTGAEGYQPKPSLIRTRPDGRRCVVASSATAAAAARSKQQPESSSGSPSKFSGLPSEGLRSPSSVLLQQWRVRLVRGDVLAAADLQKTYRACARCLSDMQASSAFQPLAQLRDSLAHASGAAPPLFVGARLSAQASDAPPPPPVADELSLEAELAEHEVELDEQHAAYASAAGRAASASRPPQSADASDSVSSCNFSAIANPLGTLSTSVTYRTSTDFTASDLSREPRQADTDYFRFKAQAAEAGADGEAARPAGAALAPTPDAPRPFSSSPGSRPPQAGLASLRGPASLQAPSIAPHRSPNVASAPEPAFLARRQSSSSGAARVRRLSNLSGERVSPSSAAVGVASGSLRTSFGSYSPSTPSPLAQQLSLQGVDDRRKPADRDRDRDRERAWYGRDPDFPSLRSVFGSYSNGHAAQLAASQLAAHGPPPTVAPREIKREQAATRRRRSYEDLAISFNNDVDSLIRMLDSCASPSRGKPASFGPSSTRMRDAELNTGRLTSKSVSRRSGPADSPENSTACHEPYEETAGPLEL